MSHTCYFCQKKHKKYFDYLQCQRGHTARTTLDDYGYVAE